MAWELYSEGPSQKVLIVIAHKASLDQCEPSEKRAVALSSPAACPEGRGEGGRKGPDSSAVCHWASRDRGGV